MSRIRGLKGHYNRAFAAFIAQNSAKNPYSYMKKLMHLEYHDEDIQWIIVEGI